MSVTEKKFTPLETKLTAVSMSFRGRKINAFIELPVIDGKVFLPEVVKDDMENTLGAAQGDTISLG